MSAVKLWQRFVKALTFKKVCNLKKIFTTASSVKDGELIYYILKGLM